MKEKIIILPTKPGPDKIIASGILMTTGKFARFEIWSMRPNERWRIDIKDSVKIGLDVDYEKIQWRSYTRCLIESGEFGIQQTPEIKRLVELAEMNVQGKTQLGSFSDFINAYYAAQYINPKEFSDERIVQEGLRCVNDLIQFVQLKLQRESWAIGLLQKEYLGIKRKIPRLFRYLQQLQQGVKVECDLIELIVARKHLSGEKEAQKLVAKIVEVYDLANQTFQKAIQVCKRSTVINTDKGKIIAANTDNPVFVGAANVWFKKPAIVIQQLPSGHTQIFFNPEVPTNVSDNLVLLLRSEESKIYKRKEEELTEERRGPSLPEWFYVKSPFRRMILNASIRVPIEEIAPTQIPIDRIQQLAMLALKHS